MESEFHVCGNFIFIPTLRSADVGCVRELNDHLKCDDELIGFQLIAQWKKSENAFI